MLKWIYTAMMVLFSLFAKAQDPYVELIVSSDKVEKNETFTVTVKSNIQGDLNIELPKAFENGNSVINRIEQEVDGNTGQVTTFMYFTRNGWMTETGKFTLGPAFIKRGRKVFKSNKANVTVVEKEYKKCEPHGQVALHKMACGVIVTPKKEYYVGEAICAKAKVYSRFHPTHYESYESFEMQPEVESHSLNKTGQVKVEMEHVGRVPRYTFEHDKKVLFAHQPGILTFEPFEMILLSGFDSYPLTAEAFQVVIKPLPPKAPKNFQGAVGKFNLSVGDLPKTLTKGDVVSITVTLEGKGNLHDCRLPMPDWGDAFSLYGDPEIKEDIRFTESGSSGKLEYIYHLKCQQQGKVKIPSFSFSYFDPNTAQYTTLNSDNAPMSVEKDPTEITGTEKEQLVIETFEESVENGEGKTTKWVPYLATTATLSAFLFLFLFIRKRSKGKEEWSDESERTESEELRGVSQELDMQSVVFTPHFSQELNLMQLHLDHQSLINFYQTAKKVIAQLLPLVKEEEGIHLRKMEHACQLYLYGGVTYPEGEEKFLELLKSHIAKLS